MGERLAAAAEKAAAHERALAAVRESLTPGLLLDANAREKAAGKLAAGKAAKK